MSFNLFADAVAISSASNPPTSIEQSMNYLSWVSNNLSAWFEREHGNLVTAGFGLVITIVIAILLNRFMANVLPYLTRHTKTDLDDRICSGLTAPVTWFVLLIGASFCNTLVDLPGNSDIITDKVLYAVLILDVLWGVFRCIGTLDKRFRAKFTAQSSQLNLLLLDLISRSVKAVIWVLAVIFIVQNLFQLNVTALVTGAGVAGLAVAFAAQNTIANLFGAMSIIADKTFKVGDRVSVGNASGSVESVGFRCTKLRSLDGTLWSVPNRVVADSTIENIAAKPNIKYAFNIGLIYNTSAAQMKQAIDILNEIFKAHAEFFDFGSLPPRVFFTNFNNYSMDISVTVWFQTTDFIQSMEWKQAINFDILEKFNAAGLEMAFPTSTNYIINQQGK
ncbi:MAG: mechanosensitive ion channel family protein [Victivallaceae bacterium]|nr:mechanosensitive ion channel family protein [Victivallaceae bacterium]